MTEAFKCDVCKQHFDGHAPRIRDLRVGDLIMRVSFARKQDEPEGGTKPDVEVIPIDVERIPDGLKALLGTVYRQPEKLDGKELWQADLCPACTHATLERALITAQIEGVAGMMDGGEQPADHDDD
jgi:hypothetical protein